MFIHKYLLAMAKDVDCGILAPPTNPQVAMSILCTFFLGDDYYISYSCNGEQANTEILYEIMTSWKFRRYAKKFVKSKCKKGGGNYDNVLL